MSETTPRAETCAELLMMFLNDLLDKGCDLYALYEGKSLLGSYSVLKLLPEYSQFIFNETSRLLNVSF